MKTVQVLAVIFPLVLSGCGGTTPMTITEPMFDQAGETIGSSVTSIADSSVAKEMAVHKTLQVAERGYYKALASSGSKFGITDWKAVDINGQTVMMPVIEASFVEAPKRNESLPTAPSQHAVWNTINHIADKGLIAFGIDSIMSGITSLASRPTYEIGEGANIQSSFATSGGDQTITGTGQGIEEIVDPGAEEGIESILE